MTSGCMYVHLLFLWVLNVSIAPQEHASATKKGLGGHLNATWTWVTIVKSGKNIKYIVTCASSQVSIVTAV